MKTKLFDIKSKQSEDIELPMVFNFPFRPEIIKKAFVNLYSHSFQKQGRYPAAGEIVSAESRNTGLGIARLARAKGEGFSRAGQAAGVAGVRKGRLAHPPESWKVTYKKINKKENNIALLSAISATRQSELVISRGHSVEGVKSFPIVVTNDIENVNKTKNLLDILRLIGLEADVKRVEQSIKKRSGKAKRRGRSNRVGKSALVVVGNTECELLKLDKSIPGIGIKSVKELSVLDLAPGAKPIRLVVFTQSSLEELRKLTIPKNIILENMT